MPHMFYNMLDLFILLDKKNDFYLYKSNHNNTPLSVHFCQNIEIQHFLQQAEMHN